MKKLKRWIAALLAGQFLVLRKKDSSFKKQFNKKKTNWDKIKYVAEKLFAFNKDLIEEGKQTIQSTDIKAEYEALKEKISHATQSFEWLTSLKKQELIDELTEQYTALTKKAKALEADLDEKYWWKDKRKELKAMLAKLK